MKKCSIDGCPNKVLARGWCSAHYSKWRQYGDPLGRAPEPIRWCTFPDCGRPHEGHGYCSGHLWQKKQGMELRSIRPRNNGKHCSVEGCPESAQARGLCRAHYQKWQKYGDPLTVRQERGRSTEERFWAKVNKDGPVPEKRPELGPCWEWTGGTAEGYGMFWLDGRNLHAHIVSFTWAKGEIPEGWERDHLCRNRPCVNPDHLEAVDHWTNMARADVPPTQNMAKTHCPQKHKYSKTNTRINAKGQRECIACARARSRAWYHRNRSAAARRLKEAA